MAAVATLAPFGCAAIETADAEFALEVLRSRPEIHALVAASQLMGMLTGCDLARIGARERPAGDLMDGSRYGSIAVHRPGSRPLCPA